MGVLSRILKAIAPLALATISIAFAITATMSKEWGIRHQYGSADGTLIYESDWSRSTLLYTEYRGPFVACGLSEEGEYSCTRYPPYGRGKTSCESWNAVGSGTAAVYGDERLCQEIHWTGNLAIARTTFIGIAFLLTIVMAFIGVVTPASPTNGTVHENNNAQESKAGAMSGDGISSTAHSNRPILRLAPWANGTLIIFFIIGAILYGFAQLYGLLAFTQSIPNNAVYASSGAAGTVNSQIQESPAHGPWIQGKALGIYGSVAWFAAALSALTASLVWRTPGLAREI